MIKREEKENWLLHIENFKENVNVSDSVGHISNIPLVMVSEDGTNFVQGVAFAELYKMRSAVYAKMPVLWINEACRNIGFGKAMLENLENYLLKECEECGITLKSIFVTTTEETKEWFEKFGYKVSKAKNDSIILRKDF